MSTKQALQFAAVILQNLPEMSCDDRQQHINNPKWLQEILMETFNIFRRTIKLGTGLKSADDFRRALKRNGCELDRLNWASMVMNQSDFKVSDKPIKTNLIARTVAELGFEDGAPYADVCKRGLERGYTLCQPEHGPQLRLQYNDQPMGEMLILAMDPLRDSVGQPCTFAVGNNDDGLWFNGHCAKPGNFCDPDQCFVFVCGK